MRSLVNFQMLIMLIGLSGCYSDPFGNPTQWSMTGAPGKNLAAQVANPSQLIMGQPDENSSGVAASGAIDKALGGAAGTAAGLETPPTTTSLSITGS